MIPYGYCHCGCGEKTVVNTSNRALRGWVAGEPRRYLAGHSFRRYETADPMYIEDEAGCWIWQRYVGRRGYGKITIEGRTWLAHRFIWTQMNGPIPREVHLDHICRNKRCVNPAHLRIATPALNAQNRPAEGVGASGFRGVVRDRGRWRARIIINGEHREVGRFDSPEEAARALTSFKAEHLPYSPEATQQHGEAQGACVDYGE